MSNIVSDKMSCILCKEPTEKPPCQAACPVGIDIPRYLYLINQSRFADALAVILEKLPFPSVCGRVCPAPCEIKCRLEDVSGSVPIRALKRFVTEKTSAKFGRRVAKSTGKRVAVVGLGPAGLTAAYYLFRLGHSVTVFDKNPEPGGMMRWGIPRYRLPKEVLQRDIALILAQGIEMRTNTEVTSISSLKNTGYEAILLSIGAGISRRIDVKGLGLKGVFWGVDFLREVNLNKQVNIGKSVLVIGGGNVAIDCALCALRLEAKEVKLACLESREQMPAFEWEIHEATDEGILISPGWGVNRIIGKEWVEGVELVRCTSVFDSEGRFNPCLDDSVTRMVDTETVILAIGQTVDPSLFGGEDVVPLTGQGLVMVDDALINGVEGVFATGDVVSGPSSVIEAIAAGRKAASSIDKYLGGTGAIDEVLAPPKGEITPLKSPAPIGERAGLPSLPLGERLSDFAEVELDFAEQAAVEQAGRCLRCDLPIIADASKCSGCMTCMLRCSFRVDGAFNLSTSRIQVRRLVHKPNEFEITFTDKCDACGICVRYCPYGALTRQKTKKEV